jgi:hypothetical protein
VTDSLNRKRQISDSFQREAEQIMKRCQRGTRNYEEANNLHAACYGIIGKLLAQTEQDHIPDARKMVTEQEPVAKVVCNSAGQISMQTLDGNSFDISKYVGSMFYTTPPQQEPVVGITAIRTWFKDGRVVTQTLCNSWVDTTPPQRTGVGLTDEEENEYNYLGPDMHWVIQEIAAKVRADEREACAKVVDDIESRCIAEDVDDPPLKHVASAIRARGEQT